MVEGAESSAYDQKMEYARQYQESMNEKAAAKQGLVDKLSLVNKLALTENPKLALIRKLALKKKIGVLIKQGEIIGYEGGLPGTCGAGLTIGPHLHFEVRRSGASLNPRDFLGKNLIWPVGARVTQEFGPADWTSWYNFHSGIDIAPSGGYGSPVRAAGTGRLIFDQNNAGGYGHLIIIDHGGGLLTYYGHLICS